MKITSNYNPGIVQKHSQPNFTAKIKTKYLLEAVSRNLIVNGDEDTFTRLSQISDVTSVPLKKLQNKLKNPESLKIFNDVFGRVIIKDYPEILHASIDYTTDLINLLYSGKITIPSEVNKVVKKYDKKMGKELDINLDDGVKRFFNRYIEMF